MNIQSTNSAHFLPQNYGAADSHSVREFTPAEVKPLVEAQATNNNLQQSHSRHQSDSKTPESKTGPGGQPEKGHEHAVTARDAARDAKSQANDIDSAEAQQEKAIIAELSARDREVRAHEQAHAAVGGPFAGSPQYSFQSGPNGKQYAVGGEVSISLSPIAGNPEATIRKAEVVHRAALAPAEPSSQDRAVASQATQMKLQAQIELREAAAEQRAQDAKTADETDAADITDSVESSVTEATARADKEQDSKESANTPDNSQTDRVKQRLARELVTDASVNSDHATTVDALI